MLALSPMAPERRLALKQRRAEIHHRPYFLGIFFIFTLIIADFSIDLFICCTATMVIFGKCFLL
jgi:hypothetical protein